MGVFNMKFCYSTSDDGEFKKDIMKQRVNFKDLLTTEVSKTIDTLVCKATENDTSQPHFQFKFEFPSIKKDIFEVYYISPYPVCLTCVLDIIRIPYGEKIYKIQKKSHHVQGNKWLYMGTIYKSVLESPNEGWITFEFKYQILPKNITFDDSYAPKVQLVKDIESLLNNGFFSDVTMKSAEGTIFKVHKNILASRSAVLKANFEHNTTECYTNIIESPLEADVLQDVLRFIYSDTAPRVDEIPEKLLAAADYYQLEALKMLCVEPLLKKLTIENAIETLQLADLYSTDSLKQKTLEFIKNSPMSKITKTKGWSNIKSIELVKSICEYITADGAVELDIS